MPRTKIDDLATKVTHLVNNLQDNFGAVFVIQPPNDKLEIKLQNLGALTNLAFEFIKDINHPCCRLIKYGHSFYSSGYLEPDIKNFERKISVFQQSLNEALFIQFNDSNVDMPIKVEFLLKLGADLNYEHRDKRALERAWELDKYDIVIPVLLKYIDEPTLNQRFSDDSYPVARASEEGRLSLLDALLKHGAKAVGDEPTSLHQEVAEGHLRMVKLLLSRGFNPNETIQAPGSNGWTNYINFGRGVRGNTPLHEAIKFLSANPHRRVDALNIITALVGAGARSNIIDNEGFTASDLVNNLSDKRLQYRVQIILSDSLNASNSHVERVSNGSSITERKK